MTYSPYYIKYDYYHFNMIIIILNVFCKLLKRK